MSGTGVVETMLSHCVSITSRDSGPGWVSGTAAQYTYRPVASSHIAPTMCLALNLDTMLSVFVSSA